MATPIGTVADLPPRARDVLADVDLILAEDTRRIRRLFTLAGVTPRGRILSCHEHNESSRLPLAMDELCGGRSVALVSDAGTPVLSDPGFVLVREARRAGVPIASVPGPSSFATALAASGQPPLPATLVGFLPPKAAARRKRAAELATAPWTLVILLSPHRLRDELVDLAEGLGADRPATLLAELSKLHERGVMAPLGELAEAADSARSRGEYVIVVGPAEQLRQAEGSSSDRVREVYETAVDAGLARKEAIKSTAAALGLSRRVVFDALVDDE